MKPRSREPVRDQMAMTGRLLVTYDNASNYVSTTAEYLDSISRYSTWEVRYVHVTVGAELDFDLGEFDAIFQSYCARLPVDGYVSPNYIAQLKLFRGVKLLAVQDEYESTDKLREAIRAIGYHVVLTCVPPAMVPSIYPPELFPGTEFITVLTGYVPEHLAARGKAARPLRDRPIHIGYRGNELGAHYGRLGFYKFEIGRRMRDVCAARGIPHDIEWTGDKRLYGDAWYSFIGSCRANLGSESGSNVFDFDGTIEATYRKLVAERGGPVPHEEFRVYTDPIEGRYSMGQISPRVFEAAAMRTPMILLSGRYSGLIQPEEHYIELKDDFSNVDTVLTRLDDFEGLACMADRAYERLVESGDFSYPRFVRLIDDTISRKTRELALEARPPRGDLGVLEVGADPAALASLREQPTKSPRHFVFFQYKYIAQQHALMIEEVARLNQYYPEQIARLNRKIARLVEAIDEHTFRAYLRAKYLRWLQPLAHKVALRAVCLKMFAHKVAMRALCLKVLLGDRAGRTALAEATSARSFDRELLVQLARVIAARNTPVMLVDRYQPAVLLPRLSNGVLDLLVLIERHSARSAMEIISSTDLVAALAGRRIRACELVFDPEFAPQHPLIIHSHYALPDLLRWLSDRPERVVSLGLATRHSMDEPAVRTRMLMSAATVTPTSEAG